MSTATRPRLARPVAGVLCALAWVGVGLAGPPLSAQKPDKDPILTHLTNPQPSFQVAVELDHADRIYKKGEVLGVQVTSEVDGYVYVFGRGGAGDWFTLYPNDKNTDNAIKAKTPLSVPGKGYEIRIGGNLGRESIKAVVTKQPIDLAEAENRFKKNPAFTPVKKDAKDLLVARFAQTVARQKAPTISDPKDPLLTPTGPDTQPLPIIIGQEGKEKLKEWAEATADYTTFEADAKPDPIPPTPLFDPSKPKPPPAPPAKFGRRIGVFIGISEYTKSGRVTSLQAAHKDANTFSEVAKEFFKLDEVVVLTNEQATKKNIEATIASVAQAAPNPGDFILLHWSGHGGECANTAGPGMKQYLIPHDGDLSNPDTMVMDDTFGEWVKRLAGRKVLVVLDACHSGGQIANPIRGAKPNVKGMAPLKDLATPKELKPTQFMKKQTDTLAAMRKLMKKVDQPDAAVIASSEATEPSLERPEGDLGVFTYYLIEKIKKEKGDVTPESLFDHVKVEVPKYVQGLFGDRATQKPNYGGGITPAPFKLRPER